MSLSFKDSLKMANDKTAAKAAAVNTELMTKRIEDDRAEDDMSSYAMVRETWTMKPGGRQYNDYTDENVSTIDDLKAISLNVKQFNLTQEENSQYIPFEMPRFYDGFDLLPTTILIHYVNEEGYDDRDDVVNIHYNDEKIRFAWLVKGTATAIAGNLKFEIEARGTNSKGEQYVWKSKPNKQLNVLESLSGNGGIIEQDPSWITSFLEQVNEKVGQAQKYANEAKGYVEQVGDSVERAEAAADKAQGVVDNAVGELEGSIEQVVSDKMANALKPYYTKSEVDVLIANIDISDQLDEIKNQIENIDGLANFKVTYDGKVMNFYNGENVIVSIPIKSDPSEQWVEEYTKEVDAKIDAVKSSIGANYATKNELNTVSSLANTNKSGIDALGTKVNELSEVVGKVDTSPRLTYDATYDEEFTYTLWEIENEGKGEEEVRSPKAQFKIQGGGGGGGSTSSTLKIEYVTKSPIVATLQDKVVIKYRFSGTDSSGDEVTEGTATWRVGGRVVATNVAISGENSFDVTEYLAVGTQKVNLSITDDAGSLVTKSWTVQKIDVRIESGFNDKLTYPIGKITFDYTPYGAVQKTIHFKLDDREIHTVDTQSSGVPMAYEIPEQTHGAHLLEVYMTTEINGNQIESNHIVKDIIWYDPNSDIPVIGCSIKEFTAKQYDATNITYTVYDPTTETPSVKLAVDDEVVSTLTLDDNTQVWQYKSSDIGQHTLTITCGETVKTITAHIEKIDIDIDPVTAGLVFDFDPSGKSNGDEDRLWHDANSGIKMTVSDNFDWVNGGYQIDENGDKYFCVKSGTRAVINHNLFADDPKRNGKEFKVVFKTTNVKKRDTAFISCMDGNIGLDMKIEEARIYSSNNNLYSPYCEDDIIEFEFNINKDTDIPMVMTYEDGVGNRPMIYSSNASFMQSSPKPITIGSDDCDVYIYRMKAYSNSLNDRDILTNFIADARNADEIIDRYNRNKIYDENGALTPEVLAEKCPDLRIIMIDAPWFTNDKKNKVADTNITMIYKNGDPILDNWTCTGAQHSGQGTSSNEYGYAGRNLDLIMNKGAEFTLGDGIQKSSTITLTRDSVPTNYLNIKVNIASSENQNNAQMANRYNKYNPFIRAAKFNDSKVKDTMEFVNCVVFIRERNEDISTHREFQDCQFHYYALGNVGDSKKTDDTRVNDKKDPNECIIEILDYNVPLAEFPSGKGDAQCPVDEWKAGNTAYDYLYAPYVYDDGEFESFGSESYEFRYEMKGISEEQRQKNIDAWRELYKFIVTSTDEEFHKNLKNYFVVDSALYYYLFTERYTMVDNRAKNSFWHRGKVYITKTEAESLGDKAGGYIVDDEQAAIDDGYRWDLAFGYDMDTSLGIGNTGKLEIPYGKEDVDFYVDGEPSSSYIYRAAKSRFFCRLRDLFKSEMQAMYLDRENANAWSADSLIKQWDEAQSEFPEEVWRLDYQRKYLRTYQGISIDNSIPGTANPRFLTEMMNGRKKYQRRMFERNQELYMATKYFGNRATQEQIMMRFNNPVGSVVGQDYTLYLTPYSDMYIGVKFGNVSPVNFRAKAGKQYTVPYSIGADTADITLIYGASFIQSIGDLSKCYVGDNDFSKASRLQSLVIGSDVEGYKNTYMTKINLGNNKLLEYLDIRNVTGLNSDIDLSQCENLLELHAEGSGATGVIFSNGGKVKKAYMPSVVSLTVKNLNNLEAFEVENYDKLTTLIVENTPFINTYDIVNAAAKLNILRLIGMDWNSGYNIPDASILNRILGIRGVGNDGYETDIAVLAGKFHSAIVKQKELETYRKTWKDLDVTFNTLIEQYEVKLVNYDDTVLDTQFVDKGEDAVDPITRIENPIPTPTKPSSVSTDFTFDKWDTPLTDVFSDRTIKAIYKESTRKYTIKYVSKGVTLQESTGLYGDNILYTGNIPTYTLEEGAYKYYLFDRWDKSGFIDGDKTVNAIFDSFVYSSNSFRGKELKDLRPVEIYALTKIGLDNVDIDIQDGDDYSFEMGYDIDYDDIQSNEVIKEKTHFNGSNYVDTGIKLFDEDRNFVIAIDYEFLEGNALNDVLVQCFQSNGSNGFKLWYNNGAKLSWGTSTTEVAKASCREMLVIRHKKGDNNLTIYNSKLDTTTVDTVKLDRTRSTIADSTLVFGCAKADDGAFENNAIGDIHWCKIWYEDLGDEVCKKLAGWTHEKITLEVSGKKKYYLSDNPSKRCSFSLLGTHLLERQRQFNTKNTNEGGWAESELNKFLNSRMYDALPTQMKALAQRVNVTSSIGKASKEISTSPCYIYIPAAIQLSNESTFNVEPYINEGSTISYMISNDMRKRKYDDGTFASYWTRSPNATYANYVYQVNENGEMYGFSNAYNNAGVLIEISF